MNFHQSPCRRASGVSTLFLVGVMGIFIVAACSLFCFELGRVNLAREQLRSCCDAAALAASAALVSDSAQPEDLNFRRQNAMRIAKEIFARNGVVAAHLDKSELTADCDAVTTVKEKQALLSVHIENHRAAVKSVVSYQPAFGKFLGIGPIPVRAYAQSGPPKLDIVLLMDISCSMTRDTPCALVKRYGVGRQDDTVKPPFSPMMRYDFTRYVMVDKIEADEDDDEEDGGRRWYPVPPQNLRIEQGFSPKLRRRDENTGVPPGNVYRHNGKLWVEPLPDLPHNPKVSRIFSDSIVLLDRSELFPNLGTIVEASRGNLDNTPRFDRSLASRSGNIPASLVGRATKAEYERQARLKLEPLSTALADVKEFGEHLRKKSDAHFSLIPFGPFAADSEDGQIRHPIVGNYQPKDLGDKGIGTFPLRQVKLDQQSDKWEKVLEELERRGEQPLSPLIGTNTADALEQALKMFSGKNSGKRAGARKIVVLISDGLPHAPKRAVIRDNQGVVSDIERRAHRGTIMADTMALARKLKDRDITLMTVGFLHQKKAKKNRQDGEKILRQIAKEAGDEDNFFLAKDKEQLRKALAKIERKMIALD